MKKGKGVFKAVLLTTGVWLFLLFRTTNTSMPSAHIFLGSAIYFFCCLPIVIYLVRSEKIIPYVPLYSTIYFIHFGNVFTNFRELQWNNLGYDSITYTLFLALIGYVVFLIAFYSNMGKFAVARIPHLDIRLDPSKSAAIGFVIFFVSFSMVYLFSNFTLSVIGGGMQTLLGQLPIVAVAIYLLLFLRGKLNILGQLLLFFVFLPLRFLFIISGGAVMPLIVETATGFFIYFYCRQKIPWVLLIIISLLLLRVWGVRDEFRTLTWFGGPYSGESTLKKALIYLDLMAKIPLGQRDFETRAYEKLSSRTNHLVTFVRVVDLTPSRIPYWNGYTYRTLPYSFIPRIFFPDKPTKTLGSEFGHRYAFLTPGDYSTSYNLPITVEMYINFGPWGVVIGMFILGLIIRALYALINYPGCGDGTFLIGAVVFNSLLNIESDFSLVFGNIIQYTVLFYMIIGFLRASRIDNSGEVVQSSS